MEKNIKNEEPRSLKILNFIVNVWYYFSIIFISWAFLFLGFLAIATLFSEGLTNLYDKAIVGFIWVWTTFVVGFITIYSLHLSKKLIKNIREKNIFIEENSYIIDRLWIISILVFLLKFSLETFMLTLVVYTISFVFKEGVNMQEEKKKLKEDVDLTI